LEEPNLIHPKPCYTHTHTHTHTHTLLRWTIDLNVYPFSIPSREGPPAPNLGKCKIHLSHQGCQNWSAFPTRMMLLRTRETGKKVVSILTEKAMAPYSSTLAWKIPWMEEPGRLQSMRSRRVGHD